MTDFEIGRLLQAIEDMGEMDNTLIFFIAGDNGTSAEGVMNGLYNEMTYINNEPKGSDVDFMLNYCDEWGSPTTYPHMAAGWAVAFDSPFTWTKQVASNYGGTRQGMVIHWPDGIKAKGEQREQWHHVIDVVPTILEATGLTEPRVVNGIPQKPIEGTSMVYTFDNANAADRHTIQYFEMFGNRGLYFDGWFAGTIHTPPWAPPAHPIAEDVWELYKVDEDFSMSKDLAKENPDKLAELQDMWLAEALKYNVLPMDDRRQELFDPKVAGRPDIMFGRTTLTLYEGMGGLLENDFINTKSTSFDIVADIETTESKTNGVIVQQGGHFGGWSFYVKDSKLIYAYNYLGLKIYSATSDSKLPKGKSTVKMDFAYDDKTKMGGSGTATIYINDKKVGSVKVDRTEFSIFSADETANVGLDMESMTVTDYDTESSKFNGKIDKVVISLK